VRFSVQKTFKMTPMLRNRVSHRPVNSMAGFQRVAVGECYKFDAYDEEFFNDDGRISCRHLSPTSLFVLLLFRLTARSVTVQLLHVSQYVHGCLRLISVLFVMRL